MVVENITLKINVIGNFAKGMRALGNSMGMPQEQFKKMHDQSGRLKKVFKEKGTTLGKLGLSFRRGTIGMRGFRMEMLSVMFFGMNMQRFFVGLLKPALEVAGLFKIWGATLKILFLPIALRILDVLLPWFEKIMNLSEGTKLLIGKIVLFGAALGLFLFLVGSIVLGIGGLILVFGGLFNLIIKFLVGGVIAKLAASFFGFGASIPVFNGLKDSVGGFFDKIKESELMGKLVEGLGIKVDESKTPWEALKETVRDALFGEGGIAQQLTGSQTPFSDWKISMLDKLDAVRTAWLRFKLAIAEFLGAEGLQKSLRTNQSDWEDWATVVSKAVDNMATQVLEKFMSVKAIFIAISAVVGALVGGGVGALAGGLLALGAFTIGERAGERAGTQIIRGVELHERFILQPIINIVVKATIDQNGNVTEQSLSTDTGRD